MSMFQVLVSWARNDTRGIRAPIEDQESSPVTIHALSGGVCLIVTGPLLSAPQWPLGLDGRLRLLSRGHGLAIGYAVHQCALLSARSLLSQGYRLPDLGFALVRCLTTVRVNDVKDRPSAIVPQSCAGGWGVSPGFPVRLRCFAVFSLACPDLSTSKRTRRKPRLKLPFR